MSRSEYSDDGDYDQWAFICYRGAVASAIKGKRGQAFLKEMLAALDALPEKKLISEALYRDGEVCALGAVYRARALERVSNPEDVDTSYLAQVLGIPPSLARDIVYENDEALAYWRNETPEQRFERMRRWTVAQIRASDVAT